MTDGRVRVAQVIARMNVGGPAMQVVNLAEGLDPDRYDVRILTGSVEAGEEDYLRLRAPSVAVTVVAGLGRSIRVGGDLQALRTLYAEFRRLKPDIVHTHTAKAGVLGRVAAIGARTRPRIHTFHGHLLSGYFSGRGTAAVVAVERALAARTDRIVAVGERVRDDLLAAGVGRPRQYVVHAPGVSLKKVPTRAEARSRLGLTQEGPVVAYVARLLAIKRPDRFLDVVAKVMRQRSDVTFVVGGAGPMHAQLEAQAAAMGAPVRFLGWRADVETIYAAADVAVLTSDNEGMPVSLIEAALCGIPAVTTDVGSAGEVVLDGRSGYVTARDGAAVANALLRLLGDEGQRHAFGGAARKHAEEHFGTGRLVEQTQQLYAAALAATGRPSKG